MDLTFLKQLKAAHTLKTKLAECTTFKLGGPCLAMLECHNADELTAAVIALRKHQIPFLLMGFGSNILASDKGVDRIIIRYSSDSLETQRNSDQITADAATQLDALVQDAIEHGQDGITVFSGIPGTVGGAIAGNAGAYGQQLADRLLKVTLLKPDNSITTVPASTIHFEYRDSAIKHKGDIVLSATLQLKPNGNIKKMLQERAEIIATRERKHGRWQETPCAGSFFRNVEPTSQAGPRQSAGWFLEQAGCKNMNLNGAHPYKNHANIITRDHGATAQDVYDLTLDLAAAVKKRFGLQLIREVRLLGHFENATDCNPDGFW